MLPVVSSVSTAPETVTDPSTVRDPPLSVTGHGPVPALDVTVPLTGTADWLLAITTGALAAIVA
jgi:hypothetical protein